jgi:hypothetical protein
VVTHSEAAVFTRTVRSVVEIEEGCDLRVGYEDDVPAVTAVTAVRASEGFELLAPHRDTAVTAVTGSKVNRHFIDKRDHGSSFPL